MKIKILTFIAVSLMCFLVGAAFNTCIALLSMFFPYITMVTATLTGYAIVNLVLRFLTRNGRVI